jgi:hypothetical protein
VIGGTTRYSGLGQKTRPSGPSGIDIHGNDDSMATHSVMPTSSLSGGPSGRLADGSPSSSRSKDSTKGAKTSGVSGFASIRWLPVYLSIVLGIYVT